MIQLVIPSSATLIVALIQASHTLKNALLNQHSVKSYCIPRLANAYSQGIQSKSICANLSGFVALAT